MKRIMSAALLSTALLAAPVAQAASSQDRAMATGAVIGATTGAVIGSGHQRAVEGALVGAVFGTVAGAIIASSYDQPVYVAQARPHVRHVYYRPAKHNVRRAPMRSHHEHRHVQRHGHDDRD